MAEYESGEALSARDSSWIDDLLIATSQALLVFRRGNLECAQYGFGIYYGISWDEERVYLVARRNNRIPVIKGTENIFVLDPGLTWIGSLQGLELLDLHQIYFYDGRLFICNTGADRIDIIERETMDRIGIIEMLRDENTPQRFDYSVSRWDYSGMAGLSEMTSDTFSSPWRDDMFHVNSIWIDRDMIYVAEHRNRGPSRVKYFDKKHEFQGEEEIGENIHNVYVEDGKLFVCSSKEERIIIRDLSTGKDKMIDLSQYTREFPRGFPRGLARTPGRWYIGVSQSGTREERHLPQGTSLVLAFDDDFKMIRKIALRNVGQILEIRAMTGLDRAHNGIPFPKFHSERAQAQGIFA